MEEVRSVFFFVKKLVISFIYRKIVKIFREGRKVGGFKLRKLERRNR